MNTTTDKAALFERAARALIASRPAAGTRKLYTNDLRDWLDHCRRAQVPVDDPPPEAATAYRDALQAHYAPGTVRRMLAALSKMYRAAVGSRVAAWNPFDGDALPRPPGDRFVRTEAVSDEDANKILSATGADETSTGRRDEVLLRLLYDTGMRRSEAAGLVRERVTMRRVERDDAVEDRVMVGFYGKGNKWHEVMLPKLTGELLLTWMRHEQTWVFPNRSKTGPINKATVNKVLSRRMKEAGVEGVHPHQFRAAFITTALDHMKLHEVQAAVGHADPRMTLRYDRRQRGQDVADRVAEMRKTKGDSR